MANKADGRIVIDTEIDVSGAKQGVKNLTSEQIKVRNEYRKTAREIALLQEQIKEMETPKVDTSSLEKYEIEQTKITNEYKKTERQIALLEEQIKEMETPKIDTSSLEKYETKLQETYDKLADLEAQARAVENGINASIPVGTSKERLQDIYEHKKAWKDIQQAADKAYVEAEKYEKEIEKIKATTSTDMGTAKYEKAVNALATATEHLDMLGKKAKEVEARQLKVAESTSIGTAKYKKAVDALANAKERLDALGEKTKEVDAKQDKLVNKLKSVGREGRKNFRKASNSAQKFAVRLRSIVASAFIFNIISSGLRQLTSYMGNALKANKQFSASMSAIKGNLLTAFQPIYNAVMPALNSFMAGLQKVTGYIASFISTLFGTSVKASQESAKELYEQSSALDSVADSAKKANKQLSDIDELHVVNKSESIDSTSGSAGSNIVPTFGEIEVSGGLPEWLKKSMETIEKLIEDWKIGDFFSVGGDVSDLVIQINDFIAEAIASVNWENLGANVGAFLRGIKWLDVFKSLWEVLHSAIDGAVNFYFGMFEEAPFETAFITAIGLWKFTGISNAIVGKINDKLGTALSAEKFSFSSVLNMAFKVAVAYEVGGSIGYKLGSMLMTALDEDLADFYKEFSSLKEIGDYIFKFGFEDGIQETFDALGELTTELLDKLSGGSPAGELNEALGNAKGNAEKTKDIIFDTWNEIQKEGIEDIVIDLRVLTTEYGNINEAVEAYKKQMKAAGKSIDTDKIRHASKLLMTLYDGIEQYNNLSVEKITLNDILTDGKNSIKKSKENLNGLVKYTNRKIGTINPISISLSTFLAEKDSLSFIEQTNWLLEHDLDTAILDVDSFPAKWETMSYIEQTNWLLEHDIDTAVIDADKTPAENKLAALLAYSNVISQKFGNYKVTADTSPAIKSVTSGVSIMNAGLGLIKKPSINANTTPAINAVSTGVSVMNAGLSLIKTPSVNIETSTALSKAEILRNSIEAALTGINIGLKVDIQAKIKDAMTAAINIGKSAKLGIGEIKTYNPPYLASGAVIPPNKEFMAVLGDQKHGMNIEAPADLIKQMVKEGIAESGTTGDNDVNIYVYLEGDAEEVFRIVKVEHDKAKKQTGKSAFA